MSQPLNPSFLFVDSDHGVPLVVDRRVSGMDELKVNIEELNEGLVA